MDTSFIDLYSDIKKHRNYDIFLAGTILFVCGTYTMVVCNIAYVENYIDRKLAEQKKKDDEAASKGKKEREDYERLERNKREEFDSTIVSSLGKLTTKILKFENKWIHPNKANADDLLSRSGISNVDYLPLATMDKVNNVESKVLGPRKAPAASTGNALKYLEIGDELAKIESKVSSLKAIIETANQTEVCLEETGKEEGP